MANKKKMDLRQRTFLFKGKAAICEQSVKNTDEFPQESYYLYISKYHLFRLKKKMFKVSVVSCDFLLRLSQIVLIKEGNKDSYTLHVQYKSNEYFIILEKLEDAMKIFEIMENSVGILKKLFPKYSATIDNKIDEHKHLIFEKPFERNHRILECYRLSCDIVGIRTEKSVEERLLKIDSTVFNCKDILDGDGGPSIIETEKLIVFGKTIKLCTSEITEVVLRDVDATDEGFDSFIKNVLKNKNISSLKMINCKIQTENCLKNLHRALEENHPSLKHLDLSENRIGDSGVIALSKCLTKTKLETLNLSSCGFGKDGAVVLTKSLSSVFLRDSLSKLNLSYNIMGKEISEKLSALLPKLTKLEVLNLSSTEVLISEILKGVMGKIRNFKKETIEQLNLSFCKNDSQTGLELKNYLGTTTSLKRLMMAGNKLNEKDLKCIFEGLCENPESKKGKKLGMMISLRENGFDSVKEDFIPSDCRIVKYLDLSHCNLKGSVMTKVLSNISKLKRLHTLKISGNIRLSHFANGDPKIGDALVSLCQSLPRLEYLDIRGSNNDNVNAKNSYNPFFKGLKKNESLKWLRVSLNKLGDKDLAILSKSLKKNNSLLGIDIDRNRESLEGIKTLLKVIKKSKNLCGEIPEGDIKDLLGSKGKEGKHKEFIEILEEAKKNMEANSIRLFGAKEKRCSVKTKQFRNDSVLIEGATVEEQKCRGVQFGVELMDIIGKTKVKNLPSEIPTVLIIMAKYLFDQKGHLIEGIFRLAPNKVEAENIKSEINAGVFSSCKDVNCISNLLKVWLRELPEKILDGRVIEQIKKLGINEFAQVLKPKTDGGILDDEALSVFLWFISLAAEVSRYSETNKMTPLNLSIVLSPNMHEHSEEGGIASSDLVTKFIEKVVVEKVFEGCNVREDLGFDYSNKGAVGIN